MSEPALQLSESPVSVLTFVVGHSQCALDVRRVLFLAEYRNEVRQVPVAAPGMLGLISARGQYVPLYDLAGILGVVSLGAEKRELIALMSAREQDHVAWLDALRDAIHSGNTFEKTTDPHACAFGRWYDSFHTDDEELSETLKAFDEPHRAIHGLGRRLLDMANDGHREKALESLRVDGITILDRLRALFGVARDRLQSSIRPVTVLVADAAGRPQFAWLVDRIHQVREFPPEAIHGPEAVGVPLPVDSLMRGMLRDGEGDFLWLDPPLAGTAAL